MRGGAGPIQAEDIAQETLISARQKSASMTSATQTLPHGCLSLRVTSGSMLPAVDADLVRTHKTRRLRRTGDAA